MTTMPEYPEHEKLAAIQDKSQAIGEFLDWLQDEEHVWLVTYETRMGHTETNDYHTGPDHRDVLAKFFGIDQAKLEAEKKAMLAELRATKA